MQLQVENPTHVRGQFPPEAIIHLPVGVLVFGGLLVFGLVILLERGNEFALVGYLIAVASQIWLLLLMVRECDPRAFFYALRIPFLTWYFAYQRWDIAKWPLLCHVTGLSLFVAGCI
jgi:hypothetical protein